MSPPHGDLAPLAVIAAPLLWPLAAILQLLFPALLRVQVRAYRWACAAMLAESGLLVSQWLLGRFWPDRVAGWLPPGRLAWALAGTTAACALAAWLWPAAVAGRPRWVEWTAFAVLFAAFGAPALVAAWRGRFEFDPGVALAGASALALLHLAARRCSSRPIQLTTQRFFLTVWCVAGLAAAYNRQLPPAAPGEPTGEWRTFRANPERTGSLDPADAGPARPQILWQFRCPGDARINASPAVVGGEVIFVANLADPTSGQQTNRLYRLDASTGRLLGGIDLPRAGISSPAVRGPLVVVGEGYHQDRDCRLLVLDRRSGAVVGTFSTTSHVESSPTLGDGRVYFGAGEDGVYSAELKDDGELRPVWHVAGAHVDSAPLLAGGRIFAGAVIGDTGQTPALLAIDATTGNVLWRTAAPLSAIAAPAFNGGRVFFALGNGKLNRDADRPAGALWCLDAATGERLWRVETPGSLYGSPACSADRVFVAGGDGLCQCLRQSDGGRVWQTPLARRVVAGPIVSGGAMYVITANGLLVRLEAATGRIAWQFDELEELAAAGDVDASPVLTGGHIYMAAGGYLLCVGDPRR